MVHATLFSIYVLMLASVQLSRYAALATGRLTILLLLVDLLLLTGVLLVRGPPPHPLTPGTHPTPRTCPTSTDHAIPITPSNLTQHILSLDTSTNIYPELPPRIEIPDPPEHRLDAQDPRSDPSE